MLKLTNRVCPPCSCDYTSGDAIWQLLPGSISGDLPPHSWFLGHVIWFTLRTGLSAVASYAFFQLGWLTNSTQNFTQKFRRDSALLLSIDKSLNQSINKSTNQSIYSQTPLERISRDWTPFSVGSGLPLEPIRTITLTILIRMLL